MPPMIFPGRFEARADQRERRGHAGENDDRGDDHADDAFADDQARREQHAELLGAFRVARAIGAAIEEYNRRSCRRRS